MLRAILDPKSGQQATSVYLSHVRGNWVAGTLLYSMVFSYVLTRSVTVFSQPNLVDGNLMYTVWLDSMALTSLSVTIIAVRSEIALHSRPALRVA
jgi:hypothetical protein